MSSHNPDPGAAPEPQDAQTTAQGQAADPAAPSQQPTGGPSPAAGAMPPAAGGPVPGMPGAQPAEPMDPATAWRAAYTKERKKAQIFMGTTAAAAALALIFGVWGVVASIAAVASNSNERGFMSGQQFDRDGDGPGMMGGGPLGNGSGNGPRGQGGQGGQGGGMGGNLNSAMNLFNADGSLNQTAVADLKADLASGNGPSAAVIRNYVNRQVQRGTVTQAQADQALAALGLTTATATPAPSATS